MNNQTLLLLFACAAFTSGCAPKEEVHDVAWYKTHRAELKAMREKCNSNPGELQTTPNCVNSHTAVRQLVVESGKIFLDD